MNRCWRLFILLTVFVWTACADDESDIVAPGPSDMATLGDSTPQDGEADGDLAEVPQPEIDPPWAGAWVIGRSLKGRPIIAEQFGIGGPVLYLMSGIHGNERSAVSWSERTRSLLLGGLAERHGIRIIFIGAANPDGIAAGTRENANAIDLNRNFATENFGDGAGAGGDQPLSEPESLAIQEAFDTTDPSAVIAVHCCVPTFDYDGPASDLATAMADVMPESVRYPTERLGSKPGSFGSYVGVDHATPIITLEFAPHDYLDFFEQQDALDMAIEAACQWTAEHPLEGNSDSVAELAEENSNYRVRFVGSSAAGQDLRVEEFGQEDGLSVLLLAGLGAVDQNALLIAEHLRRVLMSDAPQIELTVFTGLNPDGMFEASSNNGRGTHVADDFVDNQVSPEASALQRLIEDKQPEIVLWVVSDSEDRIGWTGDPGRLDLPDSFESMTIDTDAVVQRLLVHSSAVLRIGVGTQRGRVDIGRDDIYPETDPRPFSAMTHRLLVGDGTCATDGYCDILCAVDEDCECGCDYNAACEAAARNSRDTCGCDPNCFDGRMACDPDGHCDTWCPEGADPDCVN